VYFLTVLTTDYCLRSWACRIAAPYKFHVDWCCKQLKRTEDLIQNVLKWLFDVFNLFLIGPTIYTLSCSFYLNPQALYSLYCSVICIISLFIILCDCGVIIVLCGMQIVALRSTVKRAKAQTVCKLVRQIKQYRSRKLVCFFFVIFYWFLKYDAVELIYLVKYGWVCIIFDQVDLCFTWSLSSNTHKP